MLKKQNQNNDLYNNEGNYSHFLKNIDKHYFDSDLIFN